MGSSLSWRCFRCKAAIGWDAKLCSYCKYREGEDNENQRLAANDAAWLAEFVSGAKERQA